MALTTILLIVLGLMLVGTLPAWQHSSDWGYRPVSIMLVAVVVLLAMMLTGAI